MDTRSPGKSHGSVLLQVVALSFLGILVSYQAYRLIGEAFTNRYRLDHVQEMESLRKVITDYMDCRNTLSVSPTTPLPLACSRKNFVILKKRDGTPLGTAQGTAGQTFGSWSVRTSCDKNKRGDNALYIEQQSLDSIVNKAFDGGVGKWEPLFPGGTTFCRDYFSKKVNMCATDKTYPIYGGFDSHGGVCCRYVSAKAVGSSVAQCPANEFPTLGGAYCSDTKGLVSSITAGIQKPRLATQGSYGISVKGKEPSIGISDGPIGPLILHSHAIQQGLSLSGNLNNTLSIATKLHGGFLTKSTYYVDPTSSALTGWQATCMTDDWVDDTKGALQLDPYETTVWTLCCPKKRPLGL